MKKLFGQIFIKRIGNAKIGGIVGKAVEICDKLVIARELLIGVTFRLKRIDHFTANLSHYTQTIGIVQER